MQPQSSARYAPGVRKWGLLAAIGCFSLGLAGCSSISQSSAGVTSDPVCGAVVNRSKAIRRVYGNRDYYFDTEACAAEFEAHPSTYASIQVSRVGPR